MCGIYAYFGATAASAAVVDECRHDADTLRPRGPDVSQYRTMPEAFLAFHRLAIMDPTSAGDQPLVDLVNNRLLLCNGEIYNFRDLEMARGFSFATRSDCEVLLHLYHDWAVRDDYAGDLGGRRTAEVIATLPDTVPLWLRQLRGVFAFVLWDRRTQTVTVARDPVGVRPLYYVYDGQRAIWASEAKALVRWGAQVRAFPPGHYARFRLGPYYQPCDWMLRPYADPAALVGVCRPCPSNPPLVSALGRWGQHVLKALRQAVIAETTADQPIGCLVSGGLDSSLVAALYHLVRDQRQPPLHTFAVGLEGSPDLVAARQVAAHLQSMHHEVVITEDDLLAAVPEVVYAVETYDVTTVRASTPLFLLARWIRDHVPAVKVLLSGEGADEALQGYLYFHRQPSTVAGQAESHRLLRDLSSFDVQRIDRCLASAGLEVRVPFLDRRFLECVSQVDPAYVRPQDGVEKALLRQAIEPSLLPPQIVHRRKEALSDGVSTVTHSWHHIVQRHAAQLETTSPDTTAAPNWTHNTPHTPEARWYRRLYDARFPDMETLVPYFWLPRWCGDVTDPSARVLDLYSDDDNKGSNSGATAETAAQ